MYPITSLEKKLRENWTICDVSKKHNEYMEKIVIDTPVALFLVSKHG